MDNHRFQEYAETSPAIKLVAGSVGIGVGLIDQIVSWAQVVSIIGGAIIVLITLVGMALKGIRYIRGGNNG